MLTTNKLVVPLPPGLQEKEIEDGKGGTITVLVQKGKPPGSITTKDITVGEAKALGKPHKNYHGPLLSSEIPYPESKTARKKRMDAIERELDKKRLADGIEPVIKKRGKGKEKDAGKA